VVTISRDGLFGLPAWMKVLRYIYIESLNVGKPIYGLKISDSTKMTYSHCFWILDGFKKMGLVDFRKEGRVKEIIITQEGRGLMETFVPFCTYYDSHVREKELKLMDLKEKVNKFDNSTEEEQMAEKEKETV